MYDASIEYINTDSSGAYNKKIKDFITNPKRSESFS